MMMKQNSKGIKNTMACIYMDGNSKTVIRI